MPLKHCTVLVLHDPANIRYIAGAVVDAHGDVVHAEDIGEALKRLDRFTFDAAVIAASKCDEALVGELEAQGVPFILYGMPKPGEARSANGAPVVTDPSRIVSTLAMLLA